MNDNHASPSRLGHVSVKANSVDDFCQIMEDAFHLQVEDDSTGNKAVRIGPERLIVSQREDTERQLRPVSCLEMQTPEPAAIADRIAAAGLLVDHDVVNNRARYLLSADAWSGIPVALSDEVESAMEPSTTDPDRNVLGIDHIGVATENNDLVRQRFCDLLGLEVESTQTDTETTFRVEQFTSDKYGVRVDSAPVSQATGLRVLFVTLGGFEFEFLQDLHAKEKSKVLANATSSTAGDQGAIAKYVARTGPGVHHIALAVQDIGKALQQAEAGGVQLIDRVGRPGSRQAQIAFMHPKSTGGLLFHFVERGHVSAGEVQ